jgi:2-polyprenyl-6-methoxyphenol hydroxylase-like FAD-dependent oxidoreductase
MERTNHAVVIGGSLAGLLTGRVLANHFDRVTIVERDIYPSDPVPRPGVPQARHLHLLMLHGQQIIEQLFPGLNDELVAMGAPVLDSGNDIAMLLPAGWAARFSSSLPGLVFSRSLLDWQVRRRLAAFPNVQFREGTTVTGLLPIANATGVAGVSLRSQNNSPETLLADFVVDASGKGSHTPQWLQAIGFEPAQETIVNAFIGYASRLYQPPADWQANWRAVFVQMAPPHRTRGGALFPIEANRWLVGMAGGDRDYPPTTEAEFLEFARSLPTPIIYRAIQAATPLTDIHSYRGTENRLRYYDRLPRHPEHFVVVGHAACAFNPIYGQGMTVAALEAQTLDRSLRHSLSARQIQQKLAKAHETAWTLATLQDYRYRGTAGARPSIASRLMNAYLDRAVILCTHDAGVYRTLLEVMHMLKPSAALFRPGIAVQVLKQAVMSATRTVSPQNGETLSELQESQ